MAWEAVDVSSKVCLEAVIGNSGVRASLPAESNYREFPVGFALVLGVAVPGGGDALPRLLTLGAVEHVWRHRHRVEAGRFDRRPVRVRHQVEVPGCVPGRTARRDDQPGILTIGEPRHRRFPRLPAPATHRVQSQNVHAHERAAATP
jgi:hypothetical protein